MKRIAVWATVLPVLAGCGADAPVEWPEVATATTPIEYPVALWDRGIEGETLLMVLVDEQGRVDSVAVARSSGQPAFDSAAVAGARTLRFRPGRKGDRRVEMWVRLPINFSRADGAEVGEMEEGSP